MKTSLNWLLAFPLLFALSAEVETSSVSTKGASRSAEKDCHWVLIESKTPAASLLHQECNYGFRKITHSFSGNAVVETYSDSNSPEKIIEFFDKDVAETPEAALRRLFVSKLEAYEKQHCRPQLADPKTDLEQPLKDKRKSAWVIAPDEEYSKKILEQTPKDEMPEESCGAYGAPVDSRAYFEFHEDSKGRFAWVSVGQDTPLFDEQSLVF